MRKNLLATVGLALLCMPQAFAQQAPCPPVGIVTDPSGPATNPGGVPNSFNWYFGDYQPTLYNGRRYTLNAPVIGQPYIELPWQQPLNVNMERFQGKNDVPADGWELVRRDLGFDDNGNPANTRNPTVLLYNRFTGVLRVFVACGDVKAAHQLAEVKLTFSTAGAHKSATLNRVYSLGTALEDLPPGENVEFVAVSRYLSDAGKWFVADFPMDYDPCVCLFDSRLRVEVNLISEADVNLTGVSQGTIATAGGGSSSTKGDFDKGIPIMRKITGVLSAGGKSYESIDKFTGKLKRDNPGKAGAVDNLGNDLKAPGFLQQGLAALPYLGAAVSMLDYLLTGGKADPAPAMSLQPMTIEMTTKITGKITAPTLYVTVPFHNPGNRLASTLPENVPYYNEGMGVLSILTRPVLDVKSRLYTGPNRELISERTSRLTQDIKYVINPAAKLDVQDFKVALVVEGSSPIGAGGDYTYYEGVVSNPGGPDTYAFRTEYVDAACIKNTIFSLQSSSRNLDPANDFVVKGNYLKIMVNLRPRNASPTQQNVLLVARYPVAGRQVTGFAALPTAACGVLPQASAAEVGAVCNGSRYPAAAVLTRPSAVAASPASAPASAPQVDIFPNPAHEMLRLQVTTAAAGPVEAELRNALGQLVKNLNAWQEVRPGFYQQEVSTLDLPNGVYFAVCKTAEHSATKKVLVVH
ncbi:T9SS type A sorting domain-containing protein [Hymenobacter gummosus]|uniref:T9SS type A sorting domain-containing protein n=1 Tax=Hymenobacter gummosus TaxID=1776032 RepID=A0A3S0H824_9BACT|nr:T9SS type A sorting domain-containing protein [Hymenobacter gummosus]RTQ51398.1 T9SS type A sorting domain-containing protein [Hymenobacter gummosus]